MKNISYKFLAIFLVTILITACGNKENHNVNDGHSHNEELKTQESDENHEDGEEVMLSQQQFDALQMKIDTLSLRNMSGYVEANGSLEVPPQNEAAITTVVGANVVSIEVIEGDKFQILKSLQSEYESQVWNESNYNWILFAYTLLVALALLMLLLFTTITIIIIIAIIIIIILIILIITIIIITITNIIITNIIIISIIIIIIIIILILIIMIIYNISNSNYYY